MGMERGFRRTAHAKVSGWLDGKTLYNIDLGMGKAPNIANGFKYDEKELRFISPDGKQTYSLKEVYGLQKVED